MIQMVGKAVTSITARLQSLSQFDGTESKVKLRTLKIKYIIFKPFSISRLEHWLQQLAVQTIFAEWILHGIHGFKQIRNPWIQPEIHGFKQIRIPWIQTQWSAVYTGVTCYLYIFKNIQYFKILTSYKLNHYCILVVVFVVYKSQMCYGLRNENAPQIGINQSLSSLKPTLNYDAV